MRQFAIGDVHGCSAALRLLDEKLRFRSSDIVVMLGDYVDRGPDSRGVIEYLIELQKRCHLVLLRGNHEIMMMRAREDRSAMVEWLSCGGDKTLDSYQASSFSDLPEAHWQFLASTVPYHESDHDFFVHANAYPDFDLADQPEYMLFWEFLSDTSPHKSGKRMICGHTAQKSGRILDLGHAICIDTHAHGGGWLTCLEIRTGLYWQASQSGQIRDAGLS